MKIRVGILFGGKSAEHEVSLASAKNVIQAMDQEKYEPVLIKIDKQGKWYLDTANTKTGKGQQVALLPGSTNNEIVTIPQYQLISNLDVVFPVLHGPFGEDGTVQGLLKLAGVPFVGADVLGSAIGMDKDVMKRLLHEAGLPIGKFLSFQDYQKETISYASIVKQLGLPFFLKPANMGSSIGIEKVKDEASFQQALSQAFQFDTKILIEEYIAGTEIECSVLGNDMPKASLPGKIVPQAEFYSYTAKYIDENGAAMQIPAELSATLIQTIQALAIRAFQVLNCAGLARVDFFLTPQNEVLINEINTLPGFTKISMYPKLWEVSGLSYPQLVGQLIDLALERAQKQKKLATSYPEIN